MWWVLAAATLVIGGFVFAGHVTRINAVFAEYGHVPFEDWWNASNTADRLLAGRPLYHPAQLSGPYYGPDYTLDGLAYPPPSAVMFIPFRGAPVGLILWLVLNVGALATGLLAILRSELGSLAGRAVPFVVGGLLMFPPFAVGVMWANLNVGLAGLFAWCWVERARWTSVGAGVGAVLKIYPGVLAVFRTRTDGRAMPIAGALLSALGISVLTLPLVGIDAWRDFATALANTRPVCLTDSSSAMCLVEGPLGLTEARLVVTAGCLFLVAMSVLVRNKAWAYTLLAAGLMIPVPDLHFHYWIFAYVAGTAIISNTVALWIRAHRPASASTIAARPWR